MHILFDVIDPANHNHECTSDIPAAPEKASSSQAYVEAESQTSVQDVDHSIVNGNFSQHNNGLSTKKLFS